MASPKVYEYFAPKFCDLSFHISQLVPGGGFHKGSQTWPGLSSQNILWVTCILCLPHHIIFQKMLFCNRNPCTHINIPKTNLGKFSMYLFFTFKHFKFLSEKKYMAVIFKSLFTKSIPG